MLIENEGFFTMPAEKYHADPCATPSLSASIARILVSQSPLHAWTAHPRLNPNYKPLEDTKFDIGSAAHALLLEGSNRMVQIDADSFRTKAAQEARDAARAEGKHPILVDDYHGIIAMREVARRAIANCPDLDGMTLNDGVAERVAVWSERGVMCRARIDWISNDNSLIIDYKTTRASANPDSWVRTMAGMDGEIQGAFYPRGVRALAGKTPKFVFLVQEIEPPYACSFVGLPPAFTDLGDSKCGIAIEGWRRCMDTGKWPAYTNRICWVDVPPFHQAAWEERGPDALGIPYDVSKLWEKQ